MDTIEITGLVICFFFGGLLTAVRTALTALDPAVISKMAEAGAPRAKTVDRLLDWPLRTQLPISLLNSLVVALAALFAALLATRRGYEPDRILNTVLLAIFGLWAAKGLGAIAGSAWANRLALTLAPVLAALVAVTSPFASLGEWVAGRFRNRLPTHSDNKVTGDEIQITVLEGKEPRVIDEIAPAERKMIAGIIELKDTTAGEIMVPRIDVVALEAKQPLAEAREIVIQHGHSRLPVYEENIDHIIGLVHAKDLVRLPREGEPLATLRQVLRPAHFVPESARVSDLLHDLQRRRMHMAIVVDEYGGTAGLVTIEDVIEEIVGEIQDEYDTQEQAPIQRVSGDEAIFNTRVTVGEVNETLGLRLTEEISDTIGGLVYNQLSKMPKIGDQVQIGDARISVTEVTGRRIRQVRVQKVNPATAVSQEESSAVKPGTLSASGR